MSEASGHFPTAKPFLPEARTLPELLHAAAACRGCDLHLRATQTVFGEGPDEAAELLVGEQPGDREDETGQPFVGPAGRLLDRALADAGIPRGQTYVTNAVKHFKWFARGGRRMHEKPSLAQVKACRPWLEAEIAVVRPKIVVCLGATAAQSLMGPAFRVTRARGQLFHTEWAPYLLATVHPSAILRVEDDRLREQAYREFVDDLREVARAVSQG